MNPFQASPFPRESAGVDEAPSGHPFWYYWWVTFLSIVVAGGLFGVGLAIMRLEIPWPQSLSHLPILLIIAFVVGALVSALHAAVVVTFLCLFLYHLRRTWRSPGQWITLPAGGLTGAICGIMSVWGISGSGLHAPPLALAAGVTGGLGGMAAARLLASKKSRS